jgi:hypothetical protein
MRKHELLAQAFQDDIDATLTMHLDGLTLEGKRTPPLKAAPNLVGKKRSYHSLTTR